MMHALMECAVRGRFEEAVSGFQPVERLAELPENAAGWVLAPPGEISTLRARFPALQKRPILWSPRGEFWDTPLRPTPAPLDPLGAVGLGAPASGTDGGGWVDPVDWLAEFMRILQRAEEYGANAPRDTHGRFPAWASDLARTGMLMRPVADEIALLIARRLENLGVTLDPPEHSLARPGSWGVAVTHDIDSLRYWSWRRLAAGVRRLGGTADAADAPGAPGAPQGKPARIRSRLLRQASLPWKSTLQSSWKPESDPHWSFAWLRRWEFERQVRPTVFVIPEKRTPYEAYDLRFAEVGRSLPGRLVTQLRQWSAEGAEIALHPPYDAIENPGRLGEQRERLELLLDGHPVVSARYHWLRMNVPAGFQALEEAGIANDSTLGHSQEPGFRAGTCHPFTPMNLAEGRPINLVEVPLSVMDTTLRHHRALAPEAALRTLKEAADACRRVGGFFVLLWHTNSFHSREWRGWKRVFSGAVESALDAGAVPMTLSEIAENYRARRGRFFQRILARDFHR